jgi:hypothetical protein
MSVAVPTAVALTCPRCKFSRSFVNINGSTLFRCSACEWYWTLGTQAPTSTDTATLAVGGTALTVASGGASFTTGMLLLFDTGVSAEVLKVTSTGTATNIPVSAAIKAHLANATFGQLLISSTLGGVGQDAVPGNPPYGF